MSHFLGQFLRPRRLCGRAWILALFVGLSAVSGLHAQALAFRHFNDRDGLPQSQVFTLLEDQDGFIWMGTIEGLSRLGATRLQNYRTEDGLRPTQIGCMIQDRRGSLWVGGEESGVAEIRGSRIRNFGEEEGLKISTVYSLLERANGEILAGTRQGLFRKRGERFEAVELPDPYKYFPVFTMLEDAQGGLWIGSRRGKLFRWDGKRVEEAALPAALAEKGLQRLVRDGEGRLWALFQNMLLRQAPGGAWVPEAFPSLPEGVTFSHLSFSPEDGEMLLALGTDGLLIRDRQGRSKVLTYRDGLPRESIYAAIRDRRGVLWIASDGGGVMAHAIPNLRAIESNPDTGEGLGLGAITCFLELPNGQVLMGGSRGIFLWQEGRGVVGRWQNAPGTSTFEVWNLLKHPQGGVWIATNKGVFRWNNGRIEEGPAQLRKVSIAYLVYNAERLWACTADKGLAELSPEGRFITFHAPPQEIGKGMMPKAIPRKWSTGPGLLVASRVGIYRFVNEGGRWLFKRALANTPVEAENIVTMFEEPSGELWVSTRKGLHGFPEGKPDKWTQLGQEADIEGAPSWVYRLPSGQLAVGHTKGISILAGQSVVHLTKNQGLISDETNTDGVMLDSRQRLWIGMTKGVCVLDTRQPFKEVLLPKPKVMEVLWGAESQWRPQRIELPPSPGALDFLFDTGLPIAPVAPRYQVMIQGLDLEWRSVETGANSTRIVNIGPGSYQFRLRASLNGRDWVESDPLPVFVRPAWYQRLVTRILFVLLGAGLIVLAVYWRLRALQRQARILEARVEERTETLGLRNKSLERLHHQLKHSLESRVQLMRTVSHDLRSPLTSIMLSVDRLRDSEGQPSGSMLNVLDREAKRLESIIRGLLDQAKSESFTDSLSQRLCRPSEVLEGLTDTLRLKAESRGLDTHLELDPKIDGVWILADTTALQQVLFNLIENALKFTDPPGTVGIRSIVGEDHWVLEVWDTGRGIEASMIGEIFQAFRQVKEGDSQKGWGLGLNICKTLVEAHSGRIEVISEVGKGSTFRVVLPLVMPNQEKQGLA